jgi:hypothetical protein
LINVATFSYHWVASAKLEIPSNRTPLRCDRSVRGPTAAMIAAVKLRFDLAVSERHSDVMGRVARAKSHQHAALLVGARGFERLANVTGVRNAFSGNL